MAVRQRAHTEICWNDYDTRRERAFRRPATLHPVRCHSLKMVGARTPTTRPKLKASNCMRTTLEPWSTTPATERQFPPAPTRAAGTDRCLGRIAPWCSAGQSSTTSTRHHRPRW